MNRYHESENFLVFSLPYSGGEEGLYVIAVPDQAIFKTNDTSLMEG